MNMNSLQCINFGETFSCNIILYIVIITLAITVLVKCICILRMCIYNNIIVNHDK